VRFLPMIALSEVKACLPRAVPHAGNADRAHCEEGGR
jgi:hypothetical protein